MTSPLEFNEISSQDLSIPTQSTLLKGGKSSDKNKEEDKDYKIADSDGGVTIETPPSGPKKLEA